MNLIDWLIIALYAAILLGIGLYSSRSEKTLADFFLAGRKMPWPLVMISIYATSASALTFIAVPGAAWSGNFNYVTLALGSIAGRLFIAYFLLTAYYKNDVTTVYQWLGIRLGSKSQTSGTLMFIFTRILASAVRVAACAAAISVVFNVPLPWAIIGTAVVAAIYTIAGGIKAVIYTDLLQFIIFVGGAIFVLFFIWSKLPGGFNQFIEVGSKAHKFDAFVWDFSFNNPQAFLAGSIFGMFSTMAALGCDQDLVQRMLTCKTVKESRKALILTGFMEIPMVLLFLSIGASLFVYYQVFPDVSLPSRADYIFPHFMKTVLPVGLCGLLISGLLAAAMSSLDSALNALSSSALIDLILPYRKIRKTEISADKQLSLARMLNIGFATILVIVAFLFANADSLLWVGFKSVGYTYGGLLGIFVFAIFIKKKNSDGLNIVIMLSSVVISFFITSIAHDGSHFLLLFPWQSSSSIKPLLAWPWGIVIATLYTFFFAWVSTFFYSTHNNNKAITS